MRKIVLNYRTKLLSVITNYPLALLGLGLGAFRLFSITFWLPDTAIIINYKQRNDHMIDRKMSSEVGHKIEGKTF